MSLGLASKRVDKNPNWDFGVARFSSHADRQAAIDALRQQECGCGPLLVRSSKIQFEF